MAIIAMDAKATTTNATVMIWFMPAASTPASVDPDRRIVASRASRVRIHIPASSGSPGTREGSLAQNWEKLDAMKSLKDGWDSYRAPAPSAIAMHNARGFLESLHSNELAPNRLAPSAVGGVGITMRRNGRKAYVEFYNDGLTYALFSDGKSEPLTEPARSEGNGFDRLVARIREYLNA